ncbi:MAG: T9SS type A sorting domain-containing protein [Bacteroidia bacterium]
MKLLLKNKTILRIIVLVCFLLSYVCISAQSVETLRHKKYWYYKTRFNNDFVKVGTEDGASLPFNQRGWRDQTPPFINHSEQIKAGDVSAQLGIYLGVLATEYRLLKNKGQDVTKVKHELFCALNAINRIDFNAELIFSSSTHPNNPNPSPLPGNLNGFFIRDDIPKDFAKNNYKHFNYYNESGYTGIGTAPVSTNLDRGFTQFTLPHFANQGMHVTLSDRQSFEDALPSQNWQKKVLHGKEESQDQLYYLLMGTALVSKLVDNFETDNNTNFGYGSGQPLLKQEAINISDRLIKHVGSDPLWIVRNPANNNNAVDIGQNAGAYAYALDNTGCFIKYNQDFPSFGIGLGATLSNNCTDYRNPVSAVNLAWNSIAITGNGGAIVDMQGFFHCIAATCNCIMEDKTYLNLAIQALMNQINQQIDDLYANLQDDIAALPELAEDIINALIQNFNTIVSGLYEIWDNLNFNLFDVIKVNTTEERLIFNNYMNPVTFENCGNTFSQTIGSKSIFGVPLWRLLHPNPAALPNWVQVVTGNISPFYYSDIKNDLEQLLDSAPCEGTYNVFGYQNYPAPPNEWAGNNRLDRMDPVYRAPTCSKGNMGEYHGLDYMLLHNLYYLTEGDAFEVDYSERTVDVTMPFNNLFSISSINTLGGYEYVNGRNVINSNGGAIYRAGKEISLLPNADGTSGFSVEQGADFAAIISPYTCAIGTGTYNGEMLRSISSTEYDGDVSNNKKQNYTRSQIKPIAEQGVLSINKTEVDSIMNAIIKKQSIVLSNFQQKIEVSPNPNNGKFNISFGLGNNDNVNFQILDATGKIIYEYLHATGFFKLPIDISNFAKGVYLIKFTNSNGEINTKKIIHN